jgi:hypothetical protein
MTPSLRLWFIVVGLALTTACPNFRAPDEGSTLPMMQTPPRWARYDGPALPSARRYPSVTPAPGGAIVFGGLGASGPLDDAWRWDGARWEALVDGAPPAGRSAHAAVWTGDALCVWGGVGGGGVLGDGACWSAATRRWSTLGPDGAPAPRGGAASAWTARGWVIWGGRDAEDNDFADGALYDPSTGRWRALPEGGPRARHGAFTAVSPDGEKVLIWGGAGEALALGAEDAAVLDVGAWRWSRIDLADAPPARSAPVAVEVAGGLAAFGQDGAAVFEWGTARWRSVDPSPLAGRWGVTVVAVAHELIAWGGRDTAGLHRDGAVLDARTGRWTPLAADAATAARLDAVGLADDGQVLVLWGADAEGLRADGFALR